MPAWLDSIMSPLNAAGQGIEKLIETRDLVKFGDELRKLYTDVLAAQRGAITAQANESALLQEIDKLKKRVAELEASERDKERYQLVALAPNVMAYALKESARGSETPHLVCANCFNAGKKSLLNQVTRGERIDVFLCNNCGERLSIHKGGSSRPSRAITDYDIFNP
jgi:hypothetical protein